MRILREVQKLMAISGIGLNHQPFNWRNGLSVFIIAIGIAFNGVYIFFTAKTFQEYADSIFVTITLITVLTVFIFVVSIMHQLFGYVNETEQIIDDSESGIQIPYSIRTS